MGLVDKPKQDIAKSELVAKLHRLRDGRVEAGPLEDVSEALRQSFEDVSPGVERDWRVQYLRKSTEVVDAVAMVRMVVRDDEAVHATDVCGQQLFPHVRAAINEQPLTGGLNQDGCPSAPIARLCRVACAPIIPDPWYASRGPAAENPNLHAQARENNRKKFVVVLSARASGSSSRSSATNFAVSATKAGSQV